MKIQRRGDEPDKTGETSGVPQRAKNEKKSYVAVLSYVVVLFGVVLLLITLSYFMQQRRNSDAISNLTAQHSEFSNQALRNIEELQDTNLKLTDSLNEKTQIITGLQDDITELEGKLGSVRDEWAADVKKVEDSMKADYNELLLKYQALTYFVNAKNAYESGNTGDFKGSMTALSEVESGLDEVYRAEYEKLKECLASMEG